MAKNLSIGQVKALKQSGALKEAPAGGEHGHADTSKFSPVPMFLPTETFGRNVVNVQTRQSFLTPNIGWWVRWRVTRFAAIAAAVLAVLLLFVNGILAALAGLAAGYLYGQHIWADFYVNNMLKSRRLLETT